jgi:hypothetical protein
VFRHRRIGPGSISKEGVAIALRIGMTALD